MSLAASRAYPSRPFLAASIAVFRDGLVLLAERAVPPGARCFSLPGGLVEPGEGLQIGLVIVLAASRAAAGAGAPAYFVATSEVLAQGLPSSPPLPPIPSPGGGSETGADDPLPPYEPQLERL